MGFAEHKNRSRTELEPSAKALAALECLVRLLARQAAREVVAPGLELDQVAPENTGPEISPVAIGLSAEK
jgi:hypothetical protein